MNTITSILSQPVPGLSYNLIDACRQGDQRAQLQVYKIYYKLIFSICLAVITDYHRAEEIMHEIILTALEEVRSYPGRLVFSDVLSKSLEKHLIPELQRTASSVADK